MTSILLEDTHICFLIRGNLHFWTLFSEIGKFWEQNSRIDKNDNREFIRNVPQHLVLKVS